MVVDHNLTLSSAGLSYRLAITYANKVNVLKSVNPGRIVFKADHRATAPTESSKTVYINPITKIYLKVNE